MFAPLPQLVLLRPVLNLSLQVLQLHRKYAKSLLDQLLGPTQGYSLVVPVQVKGKSLESVVDTGAQVTIVNSKLIDISQLEAEQVVLRGLEPDKPINGHLIKDVSINMGGRMYKWDLYVAPIEDDFLLGLDFMIAYKIDPLVSRNVLMADGLEIPALLKRGATKFHQALSCGLNAMWMNPTRGVLA